MTSSLWKVGSASLLIAFLVLCGGGASASAENYEDHLITGLPGSPNAAFKMYSGYVTVDPDHGKALFYWFVEAQLDADTKPLTLWLNGGPGCSSVGVGAIEELGPFFTNKDATGLIQNFYSWNRVSNLLFVEAPIGVGFSYSNTSSDYVMGDEQTAYDTRIFLLNWLKLFPHYQGRDFFITGESYGGHYIPYLAKEIWANMGSNVPHIPFKGFAVGNPWTDPATDYQGEVDFWHSRALISTEVYENLTKNCGVKDYWEDVPGSNCLAYLTKAYAEMGDINIYDVYVDVCHPSTVVESSKALLDMKHKNLRRKLTEGLDTIWRDRQLMSSPIEHQLAAKTASRKMGPITTKPAVSFDSATTASSSSSSSGVSPNYPWEFDPCSSHEAEIYLNRKDVQKALHANVTGLPYRWTECSTVLKYYEEDSIGSVLPIYRELLKTPLRMTVFSGDVDSAIPTMGTRRWIKQLEGEGHLKKTQAWDAWYLNRQVGGYTEAYNGGQFKFVTVRNSGHMVPFMQPARAFEVFRAFVHDQDMPRKEAEVAARAKGEGEALGVVGGQETVALV
eukprot:TRINITY_DN20637_c0_g1_i1.p1 TRINITY_DN20637_c0_g1~~TRINITY_DN20637_c0_g1_i1.p1  ORF type:complete len:561 (+),score=126.22 TRINITY_DN20637_c0_g1_i1:226-1908(+)